MKKQNLKCPSCGKKLSVSKHYDATYEWFECPGCDGCFTYDEVLEEDDTSSKQKPKVAKKKNSKVAKKNSGAVKARDAVRSGEVINIMADEILEIYNDLGLTLDQVNARDKALILFRTMSFDSQAVFHDKPVEHVLCKEHN